MISFHTIYNISDNFIEYTTKTGIFQMFPLCIREISVENTGVTRPFLRMRKRVAVFFNADLHYGKNGGILGNVF